MDQGRPVCGHRTRRRSLSPFEILFRIRLLLHEKEPPAGGSSNTRHTDSSSFASRRID